MTSESHRYSRYFTYIKPVTKIPIVKTYGGAIFTIVALTVFILFAIKPTVETILVLEKKIQEYKTAYEQVVQKSENLTQARNNYREIDADTRLIIQETLPNEPDLRNLIQSLEQTAAKNQASISALQVQPLTIDAIDNTKSAEELTEVSFTYNLEGSYANLMGVLTDISNSRRIINIDNLNVNKLDNNNLFMSIHGKAFYLK